MTLTLASLLLIVTTTETVCVQRRGCDPDVITWLVTNDRVATSYRCVYDQSRGKPAHVLWLDSVEKTDWGWVAHYSGPCYQA